MEEVKVMGFIRLKNVHAENFLSIKGLDFNFEDRGLVGVMGPIGVGKSTLFVELLCMGMFGISERYGKNRDKVINRFSKGNTWVSLNLDVNGEDVKIDTYRKHHKYKDECFLWINGEDKRGNNHDQTRDKIVKLLDMDYVAFTNSVVFGQAASKYFSALSDADQKDIAERLLGVTWISRAYDLAKEETSEKLSSLEKERFKHHGLVEKENLSKEKLDSYLKKSQEFFKEIEAKKDSIRANISKLETDLNKIDYDNDSFSIEIESLESEIKSISDVLLPEEEEELRKEQIEEEKNVARMSAQISSLKEKLSEINKIKSSSPKLSHNCPVCGQLVTELSWKSFTEHLDKDSEEINKKIENIVCNLKSSKEALEKINMFYLDYRNVKSKKDEKEKLLKRKQEEFKQLSNNKIILKERRSSFENSIKDLENTTNPYDDLISEEENSIRKLSVEISNSLKLINEVEDELSYWKFWEEGFSNRGLKSLIIESVIPQMNKSANLYSKALGGRFDISFSSQKAIKSGELREKFNIEVFNKIGSEFYEGNSNGERRVVDSIVMMVLGDLAASRSSNKFSMLVLDDVFEKLDEDISDSIIRVLKAMVMNPDERDEEFKPLPTRESIFVLTHLEFFKNKFINKIRVEKENGETKYREE